MVDRLALVVERVCWISQLQSNLVCWNRHDVAVDIRCYNDREPATAPHRVVNNVAAVVLCSSDQSSPLLNLAIFPSVGALERDTLLGEFHRCFSCCYHVVPHPFI